MKNLTINLYRKFRVRLDPLAHNESANYDYSSWHGERRGCKSADAEVKAPTGEDNETPGVIPWRFIVKCVGMFCSVVLFILSKIRTAIKPFEKKRILLVRIDGIGDYILFRNTLEAYSKYSISEKCELCLCGNTLWKDLFFFLDENVISDCAWLNKDKFDHSFRYRLRFLWQIYKGCYTVVINPMFSRGLMYSDQITLASGASIRIGVKADGVNLKRWQRNISEKIYTKIIDSPEKIFFEFKKNTSICETITGISSIHEGPYIDRRKISKRRDIPDKYIAVFLDASHSTRKWPSRKYAILVRELLERYDDMAVVLLGGADEKGVSETFKNYARGDKIINLVGKTSLPDLLSVIAYADTIVSNDTCAVHIAMAFGIRTVCVSNGNHFGRFNYCPANLSENMMYVYPPGVRVGSQNFEKLHNEFSLGSTENINEITVQRVRQAIEGFLLNQ